MSEYSVHISGIGQEKDIATVLFYPQVLTRDSYKLDLEK